VTDRKPPSHHRTLARRIAGVALLALALGATPTTQAQGGAGLPGTGSVAGRGGTPNRPSGWEWWNDTGVQRALVLSPEKVRRIHEIFTRRSEDLKPISDEFMRAFTELDKMTRARVVDEATYQLQVVRVEALRAELNKSRTVMLYRLTKELTPEQFKKLEDLRAQRFEARGRSGGQAR
jgi:Spy/CpxP family protein refolding chaperone